MFLNNRYFVGIKRGFERGVRPALPGCSESRSKQDLFSRNDGVPGKASRIWHRQNAANIHKYTSRQYEVQI